MSTRESILEAVKTTLSSVAGGRVYRCRKEQIETLPAVEISQAGHRALLSPVGVSDHELLVRVAVLAKGETPDSAADATLVALHAALVADPSLGLGNDARLDVDEWQTDEPDFDDYDYVRLAHVYTVRYRTSPGAF